ncbi:MAG: indolepyruvate ferredoxin oxidoreductase family protein [Frankiales bacterium]|nr:indolepyruvate ferredoxin oxidoreductase family protein [Frankiales bacterium]
MTAVDDRPTDARRPYEPTHRYVAGARPVLLTGVQAIARLLVEQNVRDLGRTASFVSGYPGSPLGGLDKLLHGLPQLKTDHGVHLVPGLNEELGATAVWGSQQVPGTPTHDGVLGVWYGKGPGVDRAGDALRHGNTYGANPTGGVLVMAGDDPGAKSSTVPCTSERTLASFGMPVLTPRNGEEVIAFGMYGVALSRLSGCWVGIKVLADVADGLWTVDRDFSALDIVVPTLEWNGRPWTYEQLLMKDPRNSTVAEAALLGPRWAAVEAFGAANPLDEIVVKAPGAWLGIAATGTAYDATLQALRNLGLSQESLADKGIRLLRVGMPYPLGSGLVREFAAGLEQVLVVEEKTSFVESQIKEILYGANAPAVVGKRGARGELLVPADGQVTADRLDGVFRSLLSDRVELPPRPPAPRTMLSLSPVSRTPYFCSGCPHNRSTVLPEGSLGGGGIGCHTMVTLSDRPDSQVLALTQMGGEGSQWVGQSPFTDVDHIFQNVGDGTYFHSGQLALQFCVAAGVNITYKLLYNQVVAMTGAQHAEGGLTVPQLTHKLKAEQVSQIVVVTDEPQKYRKRRNGLASGVTVRHRDDLDAVQKELREVPGVTVLIYDQQCANEARRLRKRGKQEVRTTRVVIDEATCEGCGDCGAKSNCLSVQPVETELGRKTRIDQTSCNTDYSCLDGDCPSFLTVQVATGKKPAKRSVGEAPSVTEPERVQGADVFLAGVGGTGIVTVNQLLATAALRSNLGATGLSGLDQVGLSQKAGPVTSHLRVGDQGPANRVGSADLVLGFDLIVTSHPKNLAVCSPTSTTAVVSTSETPTGTQVADVLAAKTDTAGMLATVRSAVHRVVEIDALGASEALFGSTAPANLLLVGAAYQIGSLPFSAAAIEEAIELNGVAVKANVSAFRWGRVAVADQAAFAAAVAPAAAKAAEPFDLGSRPLAGETRRLTEVRARLLEQHSGRKTALEFIAVVERAWIAERAVTEQTSYSEAVARGVAHLWAYKDEYEVARLLTRPELLENVQLQVPGATKVTYNLHPPALRSMGMSSKLKLGAWSRPMLKATAKGRFLRGTAIDPFGRAHVRKVERELKASHTALVEKLSGALTLDSYAGATAAAGAAELVRGYEEIKLANVQRYRDALDVLAL